MYSGVQHLERGAPKVESRGRGPGAGDAASESGSGQQAGGAGAAWEGRAQGPAPNPGLPCPAPARPDGGRFAAPRCPPPAELWKTPGARASALGSGPRCKPFGASRVGLTRYRSGAGPAKVSQMSTGPQQGPEPGAERGGTRRSPGPLPRAGASGSDRLLAGAEGRGGRCSESSLLREEGGGAKEPLLCSGAPGRAWGSPRLSPAGSPPQKSALPLSRRGRGLLSCGPATLCRSGPAHGHYLGVVAGAVSCSFRSPRKSRDARTGLRGERLPSLTQRLRSPAAFPKCLPKFSPLGDA